MKSAIRRSGRHARLEARLPSDIHKLLKRAAEIEGLSVTDFVVSAARTAALRTIEESQIVRLSAESAERFAATLIKPIDAAPAMRRARQHHHRLVGPL